MLADLQFVLDCLQTARTSLNNVHGSPDDCLPARKSHRGRMDADPLQSAKNAIENAITQLKPMVDDAKDELASDLEALGISISDLKNRND